MKRIVNDERKIWLTLSMKVAEECKARLSGIPQCTGSRPRRRKARSESTTSLQQTGPVEGASNSGSSSMSDDGGEGPYHRRSSHPRADMERAEAARA
jgi:hypothetical protein